MEIQISQKLDGKYPKVTDINNVSYGCRKEIFDRLVPGESYEVQIQARQVLSPKTQKTFTARDIIAVLEQKKEELRPNPSVASYSAERDKSIKENMAMKDHAIREVAAMNNASQMVEAVAMCWASTDSIKAVSFDFIVSQLKSVYELENEANRIKLKLEKEVPF